MTEIKIEDKQKYFSENYPFADPPKLTDQKECIHCGAIITVGNFKVFKDSFGDEYICCPNAPECDGTVIDWLPVRIQTKFFIRDKMKKIGFALLLLTLTSSVFGQQALWTTVKNDNDASGNKYVPLTNVTKEVLTFYELYNYYFDLSGYNKERFIEEIDYGFDDWNWLYDIKDLTVFALKSNSGRGSLIMVMCVSKDNVNLLLFSNDILLHNNPQSTGSYEKDKFAKWFKTLLN